MAAREYQIAVHVTHDVYVIADSEDEAEELAVEAFLDEAGDWYDIDIEIIGSDALDVEEDYEDA